MIRNNERGNMSKLENTLRECYRFYAPRINEWENQDKVPLNDPRLWTRLFYESMQKVTDSGWRTETAQNYIEKKKKDANGKPLVTKDHFMMPQLYGQFLLDHWYLVKKEDDFIEWSLKGTQIIKTTKEENTALSQQSPKGSGFFGLKTGETFLKYSIKDKYKVLGLRLFNDKDGTFNLGGEFPIDIPQEYLDYEKQFLKET
tara:strand:+ start:230 stop:832 length:603 start_codon:yes stop_codon:yes gene_type:complete